MKKASRIFSLILLCTLMLLMTACGGKKFSHGTISGTTYTSKYIGLKASFDSDSIIFTDETLARGNGISDMSDKNIRKAFEKDGSISEMIVITTAGDTVDITVHDRKTLGLPDEEEYFETAKQHLAEENIFASIGTVDFLGKSTRSIEYSMTILGDTSYDLLIPIFKDDYVVIVSFSSAQKDNIKPLINRFKAY
ncbi:MAG: hypothetical protein K2J77_11955 [Oscillospiraceae bacterium]|nr:hypothetical protein [Oscillospiraceae bacterium]